MSRPSTLQRVALVAVALAAVLLVLLQLTGGSGKSDDRGDDKGSSQPSDGASSSTTPAGQAKGPVAVADLPAEARLTISKIQQGGPFPYARDGVVFENREGLLPTQPAGYYHEYTVPTPGSDDRGARRLVLSADGTLYWSDDHYRSFRLVSGATGSSG